MPCHKFERRLPAKITRDTCVGSDQQSGACTKRKRKVKCTHALHRRRRKCNDDDATSPSHLFLPPPRPAFPQIPRSTLKSPPRARTFMYNLPLSNCLLPLPERNYQTYLKLSLYQDRLPKATKKHFTSDYTHVKIKISTLFLNKRLKITVKLKKFLTSCRKFQF